MKSIFTTVAFLSIFCFSCSPLNKLSTEEKADKIAHKYIITDGHVDLPFRLKVTNFRFEKELIGIPLKTNLGDFDYERAKEGGLDAPFMSIFIPSSREKLGTAKKLADTLIDLVDGIIKAHPKYYGYGRTPQEIEANFKKGLVSLPMGMENGSPVEGNLKNLKHFYDRGIRYITLTHSKDNHICDSSYDTTGTWQGLSPFGKLVVPEMNKLGIMVDISHVSDNAFYDVMKLTKTPVIASHSSARKFTPGFERNMNDDMIKMMKDNNGVIMINFGSTFLDKKVTDARVNYTEKFDAFLKERNVKSRTPEAQKLAREFNKLHPEYYSDVKMVANHIDHVVALAGIDHVGFGSDFDGVGDSLPFGLKDVGDFPNVIAELLRRGYTEEDIAKICYQNLFRVWNDVIAYAASQK